MAKKWKWIGWLVVVEIVILMVVVLLPSRSSRVASKLVTPTITQVKPAEFKIAIVADIHSDTEILAKAIRQMRENNEQLLVVAGDLTNNGTKKELSEIKKVLDEGGIEYLVVPGNHDIRRGLFETVWGKRYQSRMMKEAKLIAVDNAKDLGEEQKLWLADETKECKKITCVVVMHMPLGHYLTSHVMGENNKKITEEAKWLNNLLVENGVKKIFVGHLHFSSVYNYGGLETVMVGALSRVKNNQTSRWVEVEGSLLDNRVVEVE